jgi:dTDP-4-amino-4,6-dideoxygalactose transaminase
MKKIIPYGKQTTDSVDARFVSNIVLSQYLTTGPETIKFERNFKKKFGSKFAISCSNGTAAIHLSLIAINLKKKDIIILPVVNFIASINMSYLMGAKIFFADVDKYTGQMTPETLIECIKKNKIKKIKAVITMYNGGSPNNAKKFFSLKKKYNFFLIEDACHALGAKYSTKNNFVVGSNKYSDLTTFSFHPLKTITTGEGGMVTTNNKKLNKKLLITRNHGMIRKKNTKNKYNWDYKIVSPGFNYRLSDLACSLGSSQLKKLNTFLIKRDYVFKNYKKYLKKYLDFLYLPASIKDQKSANHLFVIILKTTKLKISRNEIVQKLYKKNITTQIHYIPIYKHDYYKKICRGPYKGGEFYFKNCLSLPIYPDLKRKEIKYICETLGRILEIYKKNV